MHATGIARDRVRRQEPVRRKRWLPLTVALLALVAAAVLLAVAAPAAKAQPARTLVWVGGGTTDNWSDPGNWMTGIVPANGDNLLFTGEGRKTAVDDLTELTTVGTVTFEESGFTVTTGTNTLSVAGINDDTDSGTNVWNGTIEAPDDFTITIRSGTFREEGTLDLDDHALTVNGGGSYVDDAFIYGTGALVVACGMMKAMTNDGDFTGPTTVEDGATLDLDSLAGLYGPITVEAGGTLMGGGISQNDTLSGALVACDLDGSPTLFCDVGDEVWEPGGSMTCAITGTTFDESSHLYVTHDLAIDSTVESPFTIHLTTPTGSIDGLSDYWPTTFTVVHDWGDDMSGYVPGSVVLDTSGVTADLDGTFSLVVTKTYIEVVFTPTIRYTLAYAADGGGTIRGDASQTVTSGDDGSAVTAVPDTGYHFVEWSDGVEDATRTDTDVSGDISVTAEFAIDWFDLTYEAGPGGSIGGYPSQSVAYGDDGMEATAIPDAGYHFTGWSDGVQDATRTDTDVTADIDVTAQFAIDTYTLTYTAGEHGSITGTSPQHVDYGQDAETVTAVPDTGYHFVEWSDGVQDATRTDTDVSGTIDVTAEFAINRYALTYTASDGGSVGGYPNQYVDYGQDGLTVFAMADDGYHFTGWSDGVQDATRIDTDVTHDISVEAEFAADPTTPPSTTVSGVPDGWSRVPVTLYFTATPADGCTIDHTEYRYGAYDWAQGTSCPISDQGVTVVSYRSVDDYGNVEPTQTCTVRIDGVRPVVSGGANVTVRRGARATFVFRLGDNCATSLTCKLMVVKHGKTKLTVRCGSRATGKLLRFRTRIGLAAGRYSWRISAVDQAGNVRLGKLHTLVVLPPQAS